MFFQLGCSQSAARLSRASSPLTPAVFASQKNWQRRRGRRNGETCNKMHARNGNGVYTLNQAATPPPFSTRRINGDNERGLLTAGAWQETKWWKISSMV